MPVSLADGTFPMPIITAADAYDRLTGTGEPDPTGAAVPPLRITDVRLGTAEFLTDGGRLALPPGCSTRRTCWAHSAGRR